MNNPRIPLIDEDNNLAIINYPAYLLDEYIYTLVNIKYVYVVKIKENEAFFFRLSSLNGMYWMKVKSENIISFPVSVIKNNIVLIHQFRDYFILNIKKE